jgi:hypothetical protein
LAAAVAVGVHAVKGVFMTGWTEEQYGGYVIMVIPHARFGWDATARRRGAVVPSFEVSGIRGRGGRNKALAAIKAMIDHARGD